MNDVGWVGTLVAAALTLSVATKAEAQQVVVQGQVQVQAQPAYGNPPPGYGVQQPQPGQPQYGQPQYAQPQYGQPRYAQPRRFEERTQSIRGLWVTGIVVFGVSYLVGGLVGGFAATSAGGTYRDWMWVPLIGPWVAVGNASSDLAGVGAAISGGLQAAGVLMFALGLSLQRTVRVAVARLDGADERSPELAVDLLPAAGGGQLALTLSHF